MCICEYFHETTHVSKITVEKKKFTTKFLIAYHIHNINGRCMTDEVMVTFSPAMFSVLSPSLLSSSGGSPTLLGGYQPGPAAVLAAALSVSPW